MDELHPLVTRAQAGDLAAYGQIVRRFQDMAFGYAYAVLGDFHLAEDAAQEAFIEAHHRLGDLHTPEAFAGWLRRLVFTRCNRLTRRRQVPTVPLKSGETIATDQPEPAERAEKREIADKVLEAIRSLPENERAVTTLFYVNGYSQKDIAEFLEVPITTVNNRLHASRKRLKKRMLAMVGESLRKNAPDERFSRGVIDQLLGQPRPLQIEGHPVKEAWDAIRAALPEYEVIEGPEVVDLAAEPNLRDRWSRAYRPSAASALRPEMTHLMLQAMRGRTPPVRLLAAGRVFRPDKETPYHSKVHHEAEVLCIEAGADAHAMKSSFARAVQAVLGKVTLRWSEHGDFGGIVSHGMAPEVCCDDTWIELAGCGLLKAQMLHGAGYDPDEVSGFTFGLGLERLAMLKHGIDDIRKLWQPPYVPE